MQNGGGGGIPMEELQRQQQGLHDPECTSIDEPITKGCSQLDVYMYLDSILIELSFGQILNHKNK